MSAPVAPAIDPNDPAAAFLAQEAGLGTPGKEGAQSGVYEIDYDSESEQEEIYTEDDYQIRQGDLDRLDLKPRVVTCRLEKTGKTTEYLLERAAEKKKADDKANNVVPLTEAEIEAKKRATTKLHDMNREKSREQALKYLEDMRMTDDTVELDFYNRKMGPEDCERLHHLLMWNGLNPKRTGGLRYLILRCNAIKQQGCEFICEALRFDLAKGLRYLDLSQCGLGPAGAKTVADMIRADNALLELRIKENHIGHAGAQFIAQALPDNHHLERLALNSNMVFDLGCKHLADVKFGNLLFLDLRSNNITTLGCQYLADGIINNVTLHQLNIRENNWGNEGRWALGEAMKTNRKEFVKAQKKVKSYQGKDYKIKIGTPEGPLWADHTTETPYGIAGEKLRQEQVGCPTEEQIAWALPDIDFDGIQCEPMPFRAKYITNKADIVRKGHQKYSHHPSPKSLQSGCAIS